MEVTVKSIPEFDRRAKRLAKKYKSLKADLENFTKSIRENPIQGTSIGKGGVHKVRLAINSKGGGKRGGARILTYTIKITEPDNYEVTFLSIYDKSEIENVTNAYIDSLIEELYK